MPFLTDGAWPAGLVANFESKCSNIPLLEDTYAGPYDKLLNYCFGSDFAFYVALQTPPTQRHLGDPDPMVIFVVFESTSYKPVFLVKVKNAYNVDYGESRHRADNQMRDQFDLMLEDCPLPHLWGISAFGTSVRVYRGDKETFGIDPPAVPDSVSDIYDPAHLKGDWNIDILSQKGFDMMKAIVTDIVSGTKE